MKRIDEPTFRADNGSLWKTAEQAAAEDVRDFFSQLSEESRELHVSVFVNKWQSILARLTIIGEELKAASYRQGALFDNKETNEC